jgi:hypothetical protein
MGTRENYQRTLLAACYVLGDENALAARLHCPLRSVLDWLLGEVPVPTDVFLRAVDIVTASNGRFIEDTTVFLEQVRKRNGF